MTTSSRRLRGPAVVLVAAVVGLVAWVAVTQGGLWDRRTSSDAPYTPEQLRERPDLADVIPAQVDSARAVMQALADERGVTWEPADVEVVQHQRDGTDAQVVDGHPALRWYPDSWFTREGADLDDATVEALAATFRATLEPRGYTVSTTTRSTLRNPHRVTFRAVDEGGSSLQLWDVHSDGRLYLMARTDVHLYRDAACDPDPLACAPSVEDPALDLDTGA